MIDVQSLTWRTVAAHLERELADAREMNDRALDAAETAQLRGRIAAIKDLLHLPDRMEGKRLAREAAGSQYQQPTFMDPRDY